MLKVVKGVTGKEHVENRIRDGTASLVMDLNNMDGRLAAALSVRSHSSQVFSQTTRTLIMNIAVQRDGNQPVRRGSRAGSDITQRKDRAAVG